MSKLNTYAYLQHFYQSAGPFYDDAVVQLKSRNLEDIPMNGVYKFKLFDSELDFDDVIAIVDNIKRSDDARAIRELIDKTFKLTYEVCEQINERGNRELADKLMDSTSTMSDLYYGMVSIENLSKYPELSNLTKWFLIGDQISEEERQKRLDFYKSIGEEQEVYERLLNASRVISSGIYGDSYLYYPDEEPKVFEDVYPTTIRAKSLVKNIKDAPQFKWY